MNDNPPKLVPVSGAVMISEGASINTLVYRVAASDYDISKTCVKRLLSKKTKNWFSRPIIV